MAQVRNQLHFYFVSRHQYRTSVFAHLLMNIREGERETGEPRCHSVPATRAKRWDYYIQQSIHRERGIHLPSEEAVGEERTQGEKQGRR